MPTFRTLLTPADLHPHLDDPAWAVVDCRFSLDDPRRGRLAYRAGHIPGAVYAHLDDDLSAPVVPGVSGRHPLPSPEAFAETLSGWGIDGTVQVVTYDDAGGGIAARLWWMLRWLGHDAAAVLDGGFPAWAAHDYPTRDGVESRGHRRFIPQPRAACIAGAEEVAARRLDPSWRLVDARAAERFRGEQEPIDPVAGHIPGAANAPWADNLDADGRLLPREVLRERYGALLGGVPPEQVICYCGSGVTAAHDVLALAHAGFDGARLYPGSWSHWITDPDRPVAPAADTA